MNSIAATVGAALVIVAMQSLGQQASNPEPSQAQTQPCGTTSTNPNGPGNKTTFKVPSKWRQQIQKTTGITVPDGSTDNQQPVSSKPAPCVPQTAAQKQLALVQQAPPKLPPDFTAVLHCNPTTPSPKDSAGHPTTLTLPDPHDYAVPKPGDFEADSVVPDLAAKTACYLVKVDPKTSKVFVAQ